MVKNKIKFKFIHKKKRRFFFFKTLKVRKFLKASKLSLTNKYRGKFTFNRGFKILNSHTKLKGQWAFKFYNSNHLFSNIIFKYIIKNGNICKSYKILKYLSIRVKKQYKISFFKFMNTVKKNLEPIIGFKSKHLGKVKYKVPVFNINNIFKVKISTKWFNSCIKRDFKGRVKLKNRIFKELSNVFLKNKTSNIMKKKKSFYKDFFSDKSTVRFLKYFNISRQS